MQFAAIWLLAAAGMAQPSYLTTRLLPITEDKAVDAAGVATKLRQVPGVAEVVIVTGENVAYLKVDGKSFNAAMAESLVKGS
jgi:hypothetical protein